MLLKLMERNGKKESALIRLRNGAKPQKRRLTLTAGIGAGIVAGAGVIIRRFNARRALRSMPILFTGDELFLRAIQGLRLAANTLEPNDACYRYRGEAKKLSEQVLKDLVPVRVGDLSEETREALKKEPAFAGT